MYFTEHIKKGLITERFHPQDRTLKIYNYTSKVQFHRYWDYTTRRSRGLIIHKGKIVAEPWQKFFNLNERPETELKNLPTETPEITEKIDGALGILYQAPDGKLAITTRGMFESDEALWATEYFRRNLRLPTKIIERFTTMFEIVSPAGEHILRYRDGIYLIGVRDLWDRRRLFPYSKVIKFGQELKLPILKSFMVYTPLHLLPMDTEDIEGWVAMFPKAQLLVKIKTPKYAMIHKFLVRVTVNNILDLLEGNVYDDSVSPLPDFIKEKAEIIKIDLLAKYNQVETQIYQWFNRLPDGSEKDKAIWISKNIPIDSRGLMFSLMRNREPLIWKFIRKNLVEQGELK